MNKIDLNKIEINKCDSSHKESLYGVFYKINYDSIYLAKFSERTGGFWIVLEADSNLDGSCKIKTCNEIFEKIACRILSCIEKHLYDREEKNRVK